MTEYKTAVTTKTNDLVAKGWKPEAAAKRARKVCRHLHPAHKAAMTRRASMADDASAATGTFHEL